MDKRHYEKSVDCLSKLIDWRNAVYKRIGTPFPSQEQLEQKFEDVSRKANSLYNTWVSARDKATPYVHAILHNTAYLKCDVVDRSAEALEHLNKIMKSITKRGLKRYTSLQKEKEQRAKADAEGRDHRGLHKAGSGTCHHALVTSVSRAHWDATIPARHSWDARKKAKAGKVPKTIVAEDPQKHTSPLAAYQKQKAT